jgi:hypothetical protein
MNTAARRLTPLEAGVLAIVLLLAGIGIAFLALVAFDMTIGAM